MATQDETKSPEKAQGLGGGQQEDESDSAHEVTQERCEDNHSEHRGDEEERPDPEPEPERDLKETTGPDSENEAKTLPMDSPIARRTRGKTGRRVGQQLEAAQVAGGEGKGREKQGEPDRDSGSSGGRRLTCETQKGSARGDSDPHRAR
jgi:hypothetical protein